MNKLIDYLKSTGGYARMKDLRAAGFQTREISDQVAAGLIERVKPGLYRLADLVDSAEHAGLVDVCHAIPDGVICLISALDYHGLTTFNPSEVYVAIPHGDKPPRMHYPPIKPFYFRERFYLPGIEKVSTPAGEIRIYGPEKTIGDLFRYRRKLGEDLALEGLKEYLKRKDANIPRLLEYAAICQAKTVMLPYLKALVA
ncbi:type IV toxin-antitoxin system AbiEi family antitoxin domain-containing protein [Geoalkalibacter halelectricus]|uniref:Type IV toxin-antitoxin system AbiEi family antitoxin domain-containing protein n=1 Tax=Geoalkalibacter halelectricus TaxID=2847045 RepID=A0ABY5ZLC7_9BACT|nr:type IV toxin-antitoxin system AbiEi family antitoxin domain-containing protein [Geoalkalibacter halelectricus]MDO3379350.1 type IV toxin-antitoxin system AbiEi family antitoxin domain-containing protein [Geoalkalibacter halelectricus]UWZ78772.1 type IV toxin-antitoxin system AbiEi family antitoxin domain-containing protein [Geoalkalibacter halelectricus]